MKYGPALLALAAVLAAAGIAYFRADPAEGPVRSSAPRDTAAAEPAVVPGAAPVGAVPSPPAAKKVPRGGLRVTLAGSEAPLDGRLLVLDDRLRRETDRDAKGGPRVQMLLDKLTTGPKTLVYMPETAPYLSATTSARVDVGAVAEVQLDLQGAGGALTGVAVDSLQKPLAGVTLSVLLAPVFSSSSPGDPERPVWSRSGSSAGRGRTMVTESAALLADGRVLRSVSTNDAGEFELTGLGVGALTLEVAYRDLRFTQACLVGGENRVVVPVLFETPLPNLQEEDFRRRSHELQRLMALHPGASEPYAAQLRELLQRKVDAAPISAKERALLQKHIDAIGKRAVGREAGP